MKTQALNRVVDHLRRAALRDGAGLTDSQLLERFLGEREDAAFAALVRRHGPMVLGVCRRVLANAHDADDAFQATFLVLIRKAASVSPREQVGCWLYGVAYRIARKAKAMSARRLHKERQASAMRTTVSEPAELADWADWRPILDRALTELPEKYRTAVILCDLEGRPRKEAARLLGLPEGTLSSRLATARILLARRLTRHGLVFSGGALAVLLAREATAACVSPALMKLTLHAAQAAAGHAATAGAISVSVAALTKGAMQSMWLNQCKIVAVGLLSLAVMGFGAGAVLQPAQAEKPAEVKKEPSGDDQDKKDKKDQGPLLDGTVKEVNADKKKITITRGVIVDGKKSTEEKILDLTADVEVLLADVTVKTIDLPAGKLTDLTPGTSVQLRLSADSKAVVEITARGPQIHGGIISVDGAKNTITYSVKDKDGKSEKTVTLAKDAKILLNDGLDKNTADTEGKMTDLTEGTHVHLQLTVDRTSALAVRVQGQQIHGLLKGIDNGNRTVTITVKEDGQLVEKTFTLAKEAKIDGNVSDGDKVGVQLSVFDKKTAVAVRGEKK